MTLPQRSIVRLSAAAVLALVAGASSSNAQTLKSGIDTSRFDRSVRPQDDFYGYVNGGWLKTAVIRGDATSTGAFNELADSSRKGMHEVFEEAAKPAHPMGDKRVGVALRSAAGPTEAERRKIGDLYASYMDTARVEKLGLKPLAGELRTISALKSNAQLATTFARLAKVGVGSPIAVGVGQDPKASSVNIVQVGQSGLGLPDRDYYLKSICRLPHEDVHAGEATRSVRGRRADPRARDHACRQTMGSSADARPQCDVQQNDRRAACCAHAVVRLECVPAGYEAQQGV
jgi:putative endopeptidase